MTNLNNSEEVFKPIIGYEKEYEISNLGRIKTLHRGNKVSFLTPHIDNVGYYTLGLWRNKEYRQFRLHRLLGQHFILNPENKKVVHHKDGNKLNNNLDNLEWTTYKDNNHHAIVTGLRRKTIIRGSKNANSKLKESDILYIRNNYPLTSMRELWSKFNVGKTTIKNIISRKSWKHV